MLDASAEPPNLSANINMPHRRAALSRAQRIVIKVGSGALASDPHLVVALADQIAAQVRAGKTCLLVSSGAIAIGCERLGYRRRPREMSRLQAAAAAGQSVLMQRYSAAFERSNLVAAQVLLTHADLADRERLNNAREALAALLEAGAVPVVNENDTVATEEIRFGDNDQLAAMVVPLVGADVLMLLTHVEGVLDAEGRRIAVMDAGAVVGRISSDADALGTGGIASKMDAAHKACRSGAGVVIGPAAHPDVIAEILSGADVGTFFPPHTTALRARKHWIAYTLRPRGTILVDEGAAQALRAGRSSLLPVGVLGLRGQFNAGDAVRLVDPHGTEVARGLARIGALDVARSAGQKGRALELLFGTAAEDLVVVHKDDLVVTA